MENTNKVTMVKTNCYRVEGYIGKWHEIDREFVLGNTYVLLEHDTWGDETCFLVIREEDNDMWLLGETYDNIDIFLVDEGICSIDELMEG